jgi:hypothetical protein
VAPLPIVPDRDALDGRQPGGGPRRPPLAVEPFPSAGDKEARRASVVGAVPAAAAGGQDAAACQRWPCARAGDWQPWSAWWTSPAAGRRVRRASARASSTSSVRRYSAIAHPAAVRLKAAGTTARYSQPCGVATELMAAPHRRFGAPTAAGVKTRSPRVGD